jgi:hypothetical protein
VQGQKNEKLARDRASQEGGFISAWWIRYLRRILMLNKDYKRRDQIIFGRDEVGGCESFRGMTLETLKKLFDEEFIEGKDHQNSAPTASEMLKFMESHPGFTAHGYAISHLRDDYRVTIEGLEYVGEYSKETLADFNRFAHRADVFTVSAIRLYFWFD